MHRVLPTKAEPRCPEFLLGLDHINTVGPRVVDLLSFTLRAECLLSKEEKKEQISATPSTDFSRRFGAAFCKT